MLRSVLMFPKFSMNNEIDIIRSQYDNLYYHIAPHISLVFPFDSQLSDEQIIEVVTEVAKQYPPFEIQLQEVSGDSKHGYIWLVIDQGSSMLEKIHDALYDKVVFRRYLRKDLPYQPHITIAQGLMPDQTTQLLVKLQNNRYDLLTTITEVSIEHILDNDDSENFATIALDNEYEN